MFIPVTITRLAKVYDSTTPALLLVPPESCTRHTTGKRARRLPSVWLITQYGHTSGPGWGDVGADLAGKRFYADEWSHYWSCNGYKDIKMKIEWRTDRILKEKI